MVGRIIFRAERGKVRVETERLCGLSVLTVTVCISPEIHRRKLTRLLYKLEQTFQNAEIGRVIIPKDFPYSTELKFIRPVSPLAFYRGTADLLVLAWLTRKGLEPKQCRVALSGPRLSPELREAAHRLCSQVREVRVDVPGGEGTAFAYELQRNCGMPVTPRTMQADVTVAFGPDCGFADLVLWGEAPCLGELHLTGEGISLPEDLEQPVMALLWEQGKLKRESIQIR